jgi:microcompartment protein CcmL/EutN
MSRAALGLIETIGLAPAAAALDEALDTADVRFVGSEKVIGAGKCISVTIQFVGEVAAVEAAVASGREAAEKVGKVLSAHVIPRPHEEVEKMLEAFRASKAKKSAVKPAKQAPNKEESK